MQVGETVLGYTLVAEAEIPATGRWMVTDARLDGDPVWVRVPGDEESKLLVKLCWERLRHLDHPAVPRVVGWDESESALAVTAPKGVALTHLIEARQDPVFAMNPGTVLDFSTQLSDVLVHAHEQGRPHGHIEPGNLWLTPAGRIIVWGFGDGPSAESTPGWQSPERARGQRASGDADQWAMGALISSLVTGRVPWTKEDPVAQAQEGDASHLHEPVLEQWKPLGRVVERTLASEGRDRFPSVHPVRQALRAMADRVRQPSSLVELGTELDKRMGVSLPETRRLASFGADTGGELPTIIEDAPTTFAMTGATPVSAPVEANPEDAPRSPAATTLPIPEDATPEEVDAVLDAAAAAPVAPAEPATPEPAVAVDAPVPVAAPVPIATMPVGEDDNVPTMVEDDERPTVVDLSPASSQRSLEPEFDPDAVATLRPTMEPDLGGGQVASAEPVPPMETTSSDDQVLTVARYTVAFMFALLFLYMVMG